MPLAWRALLAAYLVGLALAHTTGDEEGEFKEPVLNISHLRGRTSEIGEDGPAGKHKASTARAGSPDNSCDESVWPDKDHGHICGECKVLVNKFNSIYQTCDGYCASVCTYVPMDSAGQSRAQFIGGLHAR